MTAADEAAEQSTTVPSGAADAARSGPSSGITIGRGGRRGTSAATTSAVRDRTLPAPRAIRTAAVEGTLGRRFLVLVAISGVTFGMTYAQTGQVARHLGASTFFSGVVVGVMGVTMFAVDLLGARFVPRLEGRSGLSISLGVYGLGTLACGLATNLWTMVFGRLLEGAGCAVFMTLGVQLVLRLSEPHRRGHAIGTFNAAWFLGIAVGPPLGGWVAALPTHWGPQLAFLACSVIAILTGVLLQTTLRRYPSPLRPRIALPALRVLHGRRVWSAVALGGLGEAVRDGIQMVLIPLTAIQLGMSDLGIGVAIGALAITDVLSMGMLGRASDRYGRAPVLLLGSLSGIAVLLAAPTLSAPWGLVALCALMGPSQAAIWVVPPAMISDLADDRETGLAAYRLASDAAFLIGSTALSAVGAALGGRDALAASAVGFVLAIALGLVVRESNALRRRGWRARPEPQPA